MIDSAEVLAKGGEVAGGVLSKLFPGIAARSIDNAASDSIHTAMADIDDVLAWAQKAEMPDGIRATMINLVFEKRGSDQRVAECFKFAAPNIDEDADAENLDQEWLDYWRMHAEKVRDEEVQAIWGAILAGEVNNAGAISKRTMSVLADMEKRDAETFVKLCSYCMGGALPNGEAQPIMPVLIDKGELFEMDSNAVARLKDLGLVDFSLGAGFGMSRTYSCEPGSLFQVGETTFLVQGDGKAQFSVSNFPFTDCGRQLASFCSLGAGAGFKEGLISHWKNLGFKVGIVQELLPDGQVKYRPI